MTQRIQQEPLATIDYIKIGDAQTFTPLTTVDRPAFILLAVKIGQTRLIDNLFYSEAPHYDQFA